MRFKLVKSITATLAAVEYPVADFATPFTRGQEVIMAVVRSAAYDAGNLLIETDNHKLGTYADVRAAATADGSVRQVELYNLTLGDNIRVTTGTFVAGVCDIYLLA